MMFQSSVLVCKEKRALVSLPKPGGSGEGLLCVWKEQPGTEELPGAARDWQWG